MFGRWLFSGALAGLVAIAVPSRAAWAELVQDDFFVDSTAPEVKLFVRNKHPAEPAALSPERIVLFVHGATFPSESQFDLELDGLSWMDFAAQRGWDVYAMDIRGYGRSTRPPEMSQPPQANPPIVGNDVGVADIGSVVGAILLRRRTDRLALVGWSWGATLAGAFAARSNDKIARLVLYSSAWVPNQLLDVPNLPKIGAYRTTTETDQMSVYDPIPPERRDEIRPRAWFSAWWAAQLASDPVGAAQTPSVVRAPNGVRADYRRFIGSGHPYYEPEAITAPTLVVQGEWDTITPPYMSQAIFGRLTHAATKRYVMLGAGTHEMLLETTRTTLFNEVQRFLEERQ